MCYLLLLLVLGVRFVVLYKQEEFLFNNIGKTAPPMTGKRGFPDGEVDFKQFILKNRFTKSIQ